MNDHSPANDAIDVAIIGGGPVGVGTALMCERRGLHVEVFERTREVYPLPRAVAIDDEIQRALTNIGLGPQLAEVTTPLLGAEFVDAEGNRIVGNELPVELDWPSGFHPVVNYHQPTLENMLRAELRARDIELHLGCDVTDMRQSNAGVEIDITPDDPTAPQYTRVARWVIAADGATSQTRRRLGVELVDLGFDQEWIVVDVRMHRDIGLTPFAQQVCDRRRVVTVVPGFGPWRRWEFQMRPDERGSELNTPQGLAALLAPWISHDDGVVERSAVYRFHATVAPEMRVGNVFLAGDSAHQMPPFLGQGLCSGLRDGANLAWKLALVKAGKANDALLDTYCDERLPHATGVVHHAVDTGRLIDHLAATGGQGNTAAGYGGSRPFPILTDGVLLADHPAIGRQIANPRLANGERLDTALGTGFAFVTSPGRREQVESLADRRFAACSPAVVAIAPEQLPFVLGSDNVAFVRPDRTIAAVVDLVADPDAAALHALLATYAIV